MSDNEFEEFKKTINEDNQSISYDYLAKELNQIYNIYLPKVNFNKGNEKKLFECIREIYLKLNEKRNENEILKNKNNKYKKEINSFEKKQEFLMAEKNRFKRENNDFNQKIKKILVDKENEEKTYFTNLKTKTNEINRITLEKEEIKEKFLKFAKGPKKFELKGSLKNRVKHYLSEKKFSPEQLLKENTNKILLKLKKTIQSMFLINKEIFEKITNFFIKQKNYLTKNIYSLDIKQKEKFKNLEELQKKLEINPEELSLKNLEKIKSQFQIFLNFLQDFEIFLNPEIKPFFAKKQSIFENIDIFNPKIFTQIKNQQHLENLLNDYNSLIKKHKELHFVKDLDLSKNCFNSEIVNGRRFDDFEEFQGQLDDLDEYLGEQDRHLEEYSEKIGENNRQLEQTHNLLNDILNSC